MNLNPTKVHCCLRAERHCQSTTDGPGKCSLSNRSPPRQTAALVVAELDLQGLRPADDRCRLPSPVEHAYRSRSRRRPARPRWSRRKLDALGESSRATGPRAGVHVTGSGVRWSNTAPSRLVLSSDGRPVRSRSTSCAAEMTVPTARRPSSIGASPVRGGDRRRVDGRARSSTLWANRVERRRAGPSVHVTGSGVRSSDFAPSRLLLGFRGVSGSRRQHEPRRRDDGSYRPPPVVDWCLPGSRRRSAQRRWSRRKLDALAESSRAAAGQGQVCTSLEAACGRVEANFRTSAARPNWCTALQGAASRPVCDASLLRAHAVGRLNGAYLPVTCLRSTGILMKTRWGKQAHTWELATGDPQPFSF